MVLHFMLNNVCCKIINKLLAEIFPKIIPILPKKNCKVLFGNTFWKDWKGDGSTVLSNTCRNDIEKDIIYL